MAQESTAINVLISNLYSRPLERDSADDVPELFVPAARMRPQTVPEAVAAIPTVSRPAQRSVQIAPVVAAHPDAPTQHAAPIMVEDEQTEIWNQPPTSPAASARMAAAPLHLAASPSTRMTAPSDGRRAARGTDAPDPAASARIAASAMPARMAAPAPGASAISASGRRAARGTDAPSDVPAAASARMAPMPVDYRSRAIVLRPETAIPVKPASAAPVLIARELLSSAVRYGGLGLLAIAALGIGVYLAVSSKGTTDEPQPATERDRAIAIMTGHPEPAAPAPVAAPSSPAPAVAAPTAVVTPIDTAGGTETARTEAATTAAVAGARADAAAAARDGMPRGAVDVAAIATTADMAPVDATEIEIEPATAKQTKRASSSRAGRAKRPAKAVAVAEPKPAKSARDASDPVLAAIAAKPVAAKPGKAEKAPKIAKAAKDPTPTEIAAPKGAAATKGSGQISIASNVKALIFLDGRPTGKTSPSALVVAAGDHQITLLDPDTKKAKTATVAIAANKSVTVRKDFN